MRFSTVALLLLSACTGPSPKESACVTGCDSDSSGHDLDSRDSSEPDSVETGESGTHTGESGESGESGDTVETGPPPDTSVPDDPLELCINEFMPSNITSLTDETGAYPDWIELHNPGADDISLDGWSLTDDRDDPTMSPLGADLVVPAGGWLLLYADGLTELGSSHLAFSLSEDGEEVGLFAPDGRGSVVRFGEVINDISLARVPDCCTGSTDCWDYAYRGSPGETNGEPDIEPDEYEEITIFPSGSDWAYWYTGAAPDGDWTAVDYDDSAWDIGAAPLGYGDSHQVTTLDYGGDDSNKYITAYFRVTFDATGASEWLDATLEYMRDDGVIVYLNGAELTRDNVSTDPADSSTLADSSVSEPYETEWNGVDLDTSLLVEGDNVLSVELHQASASSSDMTFDLQILANVIKADTGDSGD